jgi:hypothetical protein
MNKIEKMASKDAERYLAAEMFYGEGAGVRRRHMDAEVFQKQTDPLYYDAFMKAYESLDLDKFAKAAIKERAKIDRLAKAGKNMRALKSGNINGLSTGIFVVVGVAYVAHQTGYDKKVEAEMKKQWAILKEQVNSIRASRRIAKAKKNVYGVTNINDGDADSK